MAEQKKNMRLDNAMRLLSISARELSRHCGVSGSLISRWQNGTRPLTTRSKALPQLARALLLLDYDNLLDPELALYRTRGQTRQAALCEYLTGAQPVLPVGATPASVQTSGEYDVRYRVYLGQKGFYKVALANVEHLASVPPGMELAALCQGSYEWFTGSIPFLLQFLTALNKAVNRGGRFLVMIREGYTASQTALFAGPWLYYHLKGCIRSRYYNGELPEGMRFVASIPGYLGTWIEEDKSAEDHLYAELHNDPRSMRRCATTIEAYKVMSRPSSQYGFFHSPAGDEENPQLWLQGALPLWEQGEAEAAPPTPDGSFFALCRLPGIGILTKDEFAAVAGETNVQGRFPAYLFADTGTFAQGPHRIMLCREHVQSALAKTRTGHDVLGAMLQRRAYIPHDMLVSILRRMLSAMEQRDNFEVALIPRVAFKKLQLELVSFQNSAAVAWLQDMEQSVFTNGVSTSGSFYGFLDVVWNKLLAGWKRKVSVSRTLRKWLAGKELDLQDTDSSIVRNWNFFPRE